MPQFLCKIRTMENSSFLEELQNSTNIAYTHKLEDELKKLLAENYDQLLPILLSNINKFTFPVGEESMYQRSFLNILVALAQKSDHVLQIISQFPNSLDLWNNDKRNLWSLLSDEQITEIVGLVVDNLLDLYKPISLSQIIPLFDSLNKKEILINYLKQIQQKDSAKIVLNVLEVCKNSNVEDYQVLISRHLPWLLENGDEYQIEYLIPTISNMPTNEMLNILFKRPQLWDKLNLTQIQQILTPLSKNDRANLIINIIKSLADIKTIDWTKIFTLSKTLDINLELIGDSLVTIPTELRNFILLLLESENENEINIISKLNSKTLISFLEQRPEKIKLLLKKMSHSPNSVQSLAVEIFNNQDLNIHSLDIKDFLTAVASYLDIEQKKLAIKFLSTQNKIQLNSDFVPFFYNATPEDVNLFLYSRNDEFFNPDEKSFYIELARTNQLFIKSLWRWFKKQNQDNKISASDYNIMRKELFKMAPFLVKIFLW